MLGIHILTNISTKYIHLFRKILKGKKGVGFFNNAHWGFTLPIGAWMKKTSFDS